MKDFWCKLLPFCRAHTHHNSLQFCIYKLLEHARLGHFCGAWDNLVHAIKAKQKHNSMVSLHVKVPDRWSPTCYYGGMTTLTNAVWAILGLYLNRPGNLDNPSSRIFGIHEIKFPSMSRLFSAMSRNYRVFPGKISKWPDSRRNF